MKRMILVFVAACAMPLAAQPPEFPRFSFAGHDAEAQLLSNYLWYHFSTRLGHGSVLFNQEYLTTSDTWMAGALHPGWSAPIQRILRDDLLAIRMDNDGYVWTNQHFSHAHDQGWPFPMWTNAPAGQKGYTAGWHFQDDGPGWVWEHFLRRRPDSRFGRPKAIEGWELKHARSLGIRDKKWQLEADGDSPCITTPAGVTIDAFNAPFVQLRWKRDPAPPAGRLPYIEWLREEDTGYSAERRVYLPLTGGNPDYEKISGATHSQAAMYLHPLWNGRIKRIRIALAPGESHVRFAIDSFFTAYDTRHTINNSIYVLAAWNYFRWTGDIEFLSRVMNRMRRAVRYQQTVLGGLEFNHIRNRWPGHDGLAGYTTKPDGSKQMHYGHGIGNNYWDIMPFGWDDMYSTSQYYASLLAMAEAEQAVRDNPGWGIPAGDEALDPAALRRHASQVKRTANKKFWSKKTGRFVACIDKEGKAHDYGFTFLNLDAIWYGIASDRHAAEIMDWMSGRRNVEGDTSTGGDIYHWRFGPRATTKRNLEWYGQGWTRPEKIPWGGQVQDGGAVLGFSFYDLWANLKVLGPERAWQRLAELLAWEKDVWAEGGYRKYYEGGKHGTTLQGGGTAGGIGIDAEFFESSLVPSIVVYGFLGLQPQASSLRIEPHLPAAVPEIGVTNLLYRGTRMDVKASARNMEIVVKQRPWDPVRLEVPAGWRLHGAAGAQTSFALAEAGSYRFERVSER